MKVALIKYNGGNIRSVECALKRLGVNSTVTNNPKEIFEADKVIFPGVGEASSTMASLHDSGLVEVIKQLTKPFLGICLGMQVLSSFSEENNTKCLNLIQGLECKKFLGGDLKIPHMGWNKVYGLNCPLFKEIEEDTICRCLLTLSLVLTINQHLLQLLELIIFLVFSFILKRVTTAAKNF
jgi:imidazole glycerol-phosphate synthase subunit HisH